MKFSDRLKQQRKLKGITQKAIATLVGVSNVAVSRWELGHSIPAGEALSKLADILECSSEWLLNGNQFDEVAMVDFFSDISAAAGNGNYNYHEVSEKTPIPKWIVDQQPCSNKVCCIRVTGNSMEPVLKNGSIIALNPCMKTIKDGMMYVIRQDDLLRVKILIETPDSLIVRSYNRDFSDEIYPKSGENNVEIIGQVFWHSSYIHI
ncbi:S24 family peptidase [Vibrio alginolyticus]|uniref:S24 family peptidase n=1 Tax=Vibrio alginolyticus TaxID=663 RepID=UPI0007212849|nr:S24 family peptidase [Vibrio alginolyticus]ALR95787.1 phage repressor protein [Vibrio alginolyticus]MBY7710663.1 helix-turn-helix domain-containing protein [Vibrio alginolyticus]